MVIILTLKEFLRTNRNARRIFGEKELGTNTSVSLSQGLFTKMVMLSVAVQPFVSVTVRIKIVVIVGVGYMVEVVSPVFQR